MQMNENDIFMTLYVLSILAVILLIVIGDVIISKAKEARLEQAKERAREADLYARYQRMREPPLDYAALQDELDAEFGTLSIGRSAGMQ